MTKRPNILFIIADQHNAKVLGHQRHPDVKTPNLDRLASEGVRFQSAITQNPICTPSRVSFLSGQYPHNHGYYGLSGRNPGGLPTIIGHFRRAGYRTAAVGKIHCPESWVEDDCDYFREVYPDCSIGGCPEYDAYLGKKGLLQLRDDICYPEHGPRGMQSCDGRPSRLKYEDTVEGWTVREAMRFMEQASGEARPFIAHVSLPRPHQMYTPSEPFWSMYDEAKLSLPPNADYDMKNKAPHLREAATHWRTGHWALFEPKTFEAARLRKLHGYLGCISQVDHAVGELLTWLKDKGLAEDTIVVYTSDHGDYACEHGNLEKAPGICSDAITRIPFIWRWPGRFKAGHAAAQIVEAVDLSATLCSLAALDPLQTSDGRDLSPLLRGENAELHKLGVTEFAWSKSVRADCGNPKGKFRYVYYPPDMFPEDYPDGNFGELYDLENDPWEMNNLYFDPQHQNVVAELRRDLLDWLVTTARPCTILPMAHFTGDQAVTRYGNTTNFDGKLPPDRIRQIRGKHYI